MSNGASFDGNGFIGHGCTPGELVYYPLPAFCNDRVQNPDEIGAPSYTEQCLGATTPVYTYGITTTLSLSQRLTFDVVGEGMGGHWLSSGTAYQNTRRSVWPPCRSTFDAIAAGQRNSLSAGERALCDPSVTRYGMWTQPADFFKIRSGVTEFPGSGAMAAGAVPCGDVASAGQESVHDDRLRGRGS